MLINVYHQIIETKQELKKAHRMKMLRILLLFILIPALFTSTSIFLLTILIKYCVGLALISNLINFKKTMEVITVLNCSLGSLEHFKTMLEEEREREEAKELENTQTLEEQTPLLENDLSYESLKLEQAPILSRQRKR